MPMHKAKQTKPTYCKQRLKTTYSQTNQATHSQTNPNQPTAKQSKKSTTKQNYIDHYQKEIIILLCKRNRNLKYY